LLQETVAGVTTSYLVADQNLIGYTQVMDELKGGAVSRTYSYGLSLIHERQIIAGASTTSFYGYDGHGSVFLTSSTGSVTDTYDYDAFGSLISSTGSTPNNYLFAGEQFDPLLGIYYNRARDYDQRRGRFWTMDTWEGMSRIQEAATCFSMCYHQLTMSIRVVIVCPQTRAGEKSSKAGYSKISLREFRGACVSRCTAFPSAAAGLRRLQARSALRHALTYVTLAHPLPRT
jgi:RHS repeat-associated protein